MSMTDGIFAGNVRRILHEGPVERINFVYKHRIGHPYWSLLAQSIRRGEIRCVVNPQLVSPGATATYNSGTIAALSENVDTAIVVHECTHAIVDRLKWNLSRVDDETCAYLAQAFNFVARGISPADPISRTAVHIVSGITGDEHSFSESEVKPLKAEIHKSPLYR